MRYLDYNAGAPLRPEVAAHLGSAFPGSDGNPSSVHQAGRAARRRLDAAREAVAATLGCTPREVIFTGSGSEAAALAVLGAFRGRKDQARKRIVTSALEHPCVLGAMALLEQEGAEVVRVRPGPDGRVSAEAMIAALGPATCACSLLWVNNETGVIQPVPELARACAAKGIVFHTDAVQAVGKLPATLREAPADLFSFSAHKLGGPAGVGALTVRRGTALQPLVPGHQEDGRRGGTQGVVMAEALALALALATAEQAAESARLTALRDRFERELSAKLPGVTVNGGGAPRACNTSNLRVDGADGEAVLIALDLEGICVSTGAACASGSLKPSHVLLAMGLTSAQAHASLRISFGKGSTDADVDAAVDALARHIPRTLDHPLPGVAGRG